MRRTPTEVDGALHLYSTKEAVANHNVEKLHAIQVQVLQVMTGTYS